MLTAEVLRRRHAAGEVDSLNNYSEEDRLPLEEFVKLPTTVDFQVINSDRFQSYAASRPYIHLGTRLANDYTVAYTNEENIDTILRELGNDFLSLTPKIMSPLDIQSNDASGITPVLNQPYLDLSGQGVIIGFVDTGIDYLNPAFRFEDGSTKIISIWDQTLDGERGGGVYFGSTYDSDRINTALNSSDPYSVVPQYDEDGHGTFLASVAASNEKGEYIGAAPRANIVSVKLRRARNYYIDKYLLSHDDPNLCESTDYILGIKYILDKANELDMPVVICIGFGSNTSAHDGNTLFEDYISFISQRPGYAVVAAAGNEANKKHHTSGRLMKGSEYETIGIRVGKQGESFTTLICSPAFDKISVGVVSPTGEVVARKPFRSGNEYRESLLLENSEVIIKYYKDISNNIFIGIKNATDGIWEIRLYGDNLVDGNYHAWLPISGQVSTEIEFLRPVPEYTIVFPAAAQRIISCGAYDIRDGSLSVASSWGPTTDGTIAPDLTAPGVSVQGIYPDGYGTMTGTSVASAVTAGAAALLMEWGLIKNNVPNLSGSLIQSLLISGCRRQDNTVYPNVKWGYGRLDLYNSFLFLRETV